jgi:hypothetical protein
MLFRATGIVRMKLGKLDEAETALRESLSLYEKTGPGSWTYWHVASLLGGCLAGQERFAEAEPLLLDGYLKMQPPGAPVPRRWHRAAGERIVALYEAWGKPEKAAEWRARLAKGGDDE